MQTGLESIRTEVAGSNRTGSAQHRTSILNLRCVRNMEISENLPFVCQEHLLVRGMLCSVAMFHVEEEPDKPQHMQRNSETCSLV